MKKVKKMLALLLAMAMVLGLSATALADGDHKPIPTDSAEITVNGVGTGATVKAYKIAEGKWNDLGFLGYEALEFELEKPDPDDPNNKITANVKIADLAKPTATEITDLAKAVKENGTTGTELTEKPEGSGVYKATLEVGMYLILVTQNGEDDMNAYNPMIASVYYSTEKSGDMNDAIAGTVDATKDFVIDGSTLFAKHMKPDITKEIVSPLEKDNNKYGNDTAIGDVITFEVNTAFPAYSDEYTEVEFNIIDTLSKGLTLKADTVTVTEVTGANPAPVKGTDYTVTPSTDSATGVTTMTISFTSDFILKNRGANVTVQYNASLNEDAGINFDKNTNTVKAEYTNNPITKDKGTTEEKRTYHYTFGIDASINGVAEEITKELLKTGEEFVTGSTTEKAPLNGATFTLTEATRDSENKLVPVKDGSVYTTISGIGEVGKDVNADGTALDGKNVFGEDYAGYLKFTGLDAGEYILQETKAPEGYSLNPVQIPVKIEAEYNTDGTLKSYKITVDGTVIEEDDVKTSTYTAEYKKDSATGEANIDPDHKPNPGASDTQEIPNTKIIQLPSTGGIGTTIFTIGGCAIMIIAAGLYFASRRKKVK